MNQDPAALRRALVTAALRQVPFDGWTARALRRGAGDAGIDVPTMLRLCPQGIEDVIADFGARLDGAVLQALAPGAALPASIRQRVGVAVRARLEAARPDREALRALVTRAALPAHTPAALAAIYRTVDAIWHAVGDRAVDASFYSKRALLAGVYGTTLLYWLDDRSEGQAETWGFLERRIADVMRIQKARGGIDRALGRVGRCAGRLLRGFGRAPAAPSRQTNS